MPKYMTDQWFNGPETKACQLNKRSASSSSRGLPKIKSKPRSISLAALVLAAGLLAFNNSYAQGEHSRRVAAELAVALGDVRMLKNAVASLKDKMQVQRQEQTPKQAEHGALHRVGLVQRIKGAITGLEILARLADEEANNIVLSRKAELDVLLINVEQRQWDAVEKALNDIQTTYPLQIPDLNIQDTSAFAELHQSLCAACHDRPNLEVERPAYNLFEQTASISGLEMFARMLTGVRGDASTGIDNPLSDRQILGLLSWYQISGKKAGQAR